MAHLAPRFGVTALASGSRRRPGAAARAAVGAVAVMGLGLPATRVARALGVTPMPLLRALPRGCALLEGRGRSVAGVAQEVIRKSD